MNRSASRALGPLAAAPPLSARSRQKDVKRCMRRLIGLTAAAIVAGCVASAPPREFPPGASRLLPAAPAAAVLYVALGDSTVEGVGASAPPRHYVGRLHERLLAVYPHARLINLGVGGATAAGVLRRQLPRALE